MGGFGRKSNYATDCRIILAKTYPFGLGGLKFYLIGMRIGKNGERRERKFRLILKLKKM
jgi:hypothetical protein